MGLFVPKLLPGEEIVYKTGDSFLESLFSIGILVLALLFYFKFFDNSFWLLVYRELIGLIFGTGWLVWIFFILFLYFIPRDKFYVTNMRIFINYLFHYSIDLNDVEKVETKRGKVKIQLKKKPMPIMNTWVNNAEKFVEQINQQKSMSAGIPESLKIDYAKQFLRRFIVMSSCIMYLCLLVVFKVCPYSLIFAARAMCILYPSNYASYAVIGQDYYYKKDYDKALKYLLKADKLNPKDAFVSECLGFIYYDQTTDYKKALYYANKAINVDPKEVWEYYTRGRIYLALKEYDKARKDEEKNYAVTKNPRVALVLALIETDTGNYKKAESYIKTDIIPFLKKNNWLYEDYDKLTEIYQKMGNREKYKQAVIDAQKARQRYYTEDRHKVY